MIKAGCRLHRVNRRCELKIRTSDFDISICVIIVLQNNGKPSAVNYATGVMINSLSLKYTT